MPTPQTEYRYPCENCGASLRFRPGQQVLVCDYCGYEQRIGGGAARAPARQATGGAEAAAAILAQPETGRALQWGAAPKYPD
ncbi:MAG: zinc ribbon domain-containing protein, partial [Paracoccus sp. (in: a-proteobacteria)]